MSDVNDEIARTFSAARSALLALKEHSLRHPIQMKQCREEVYELQDLADQLYGQCCGWYREVA